jgi:diketogulonate reductase-like aldo/keto reductase
MDAGLVRSVGVSNHNVEQMRTAHRILKERGVPLAYNQLQYRCVRVFV